MVFQLWVCFEQKNSSWVRFCHSQGHQVSAALDDNPKYVGYVRLNFLLGRADSTLLADNYGIAQRIGDFRIGDVLSGFQQPLATSNIQEDCFFRLSLEMVAVRAFKFFHVGASDQGA